MRFGTGCSGARREAEEEQDMITGEQIRQARKLLGWSQESLAGQVGVSATTLRQFEKGRRVLKLDLALLRGALESAGVEFTNDPAPRVGLKISAAKAPPG